jgi:hypothetical protein
MYFPATAMPHGLAPCQAGERGMPMPVMNWSSTPVPSTFALPIAPPLEGAHQQSLPGTIAQAQLAQ